MSQVPRLATIEGTIGAPTPSLARFATNNGTRIHYQDRWAVMPAAAPARDGARTAT
jgi:hypothetical protein